jgi:hypothetical protein
MYQLAEHVRAIGDEDGMTLLDLKANQILALNKIGGFIWEGLQSGNSLDSIVSNIADATGAEKHLIEKDMQEFIGTLTEKGLVADTEQTK